MKDKFIAILLIISLILISTSAFLYFNEPIKEKNDSKVGYKELPENENPKPINETEKPPYRNETKNIPEQKETPNESEDSKTEENISENNVENETSNTEVKRKNAIWVYANEQSYAKKATSKIKQINSALPNDEKIKYLFISSSAIEIRNNSDTKYATAYTYDSVNLTHFYKNFPEMKIHTMLEASKKSMENLEHANKTWIKEMASDLNKDIKNNSENIDGVHLDLEPYTDKVGELIDVFENQSDLPTSVALGGKYDQANSKAVNKTGLPVLMNYAQGTNSLESFGNAFESRAKDFFNECQEYNKKCMNGIPISETSTEKSNIHNYTKISLEKHRQFKEQSEGIAFFGINYRTGKIPTNKTIQTLAENI